MNVAIHEASHAVAGLRFGFEVSKVSIVPIPGEAGRCKFDVNRNPEVPAERCAATLVAGRIGEQMAGGQRERVSWLDVDDSDVAGALALLEQLPNPMTGRQLAELLARSALFTRWFQVRRLAERLESRRTLVGEEIREIALGVKRIDPSRHSTLVNGKRHSLRKVADAVDQAGYEFDPVTRSPIGLRLLEKPEKTGGRR